MKLIAHRGNINGPNPERENDPIYVQEAIDKGYYVEVDLQISPHNDLWLGHDTLDYIVSRRFLEQEEVFVHLKNYSKWYDPAFLNMKVFTQEENEESSVVHASEKLVWVNSSHSLSERYHRDFCILNDSPEIRGKLPSFGIYGICSDYVEEYQSNNLNRLLLDVDGVLTKNKMYSMDSLTVYKAFNDRDWTAIKRFKAAGVKVASISGDISNKKLLESRNIEFIYSPPIDGVIDKLSSLSPEYLLNAIYIGDDYYDISLMQVLGKNNSYCPADSPNDVKNAATVLTTNGGEGCIAELYDLYQPQLKQGYPYDNL